MGIWYVFVVPWPSKYETSSAVITRNTKYNFTSDFPSVFETCYLINRFICLPFFQATQDPRQELTAIQKQLHIKITNIKYNKSKHSTIKTLLNTSLKTPYASLAGYSSFSQAIPILPKIFLFYSFQKTKSSTDLFFHRSSFTSMGQLQGPGCRRTSLRQRQQQQ